MHTKLYRYITLTTGTELALRHIRDGVELNPIDVNRNYDSNYQRTNFITNVQILPVSSYICISS